MGKTKKINHQNQAITLENLSLPEAIYEKGLLALAKKDKYLNPLLFIYDNIFREPAEKTKYILTEDLFKPDGFNRGYANKCQAIDEYEVYDIFFNWIEAIKAKPFLNGVATTPKKSFLDDADSAQNKPLLMDLLEISSPSSKLGHLFFHLETSKNTVLIPEAIILIEECHGFFRNNFSFGDKEWLKELDRMAGAYKKYCQLNEEDKKSKKIVEKIIKEYRELKRPMKYMDFKPYIKFKADEVLNRVYSQIAEQYAQSIKNSTSENYYKMFLAYNTPWIYNYILALEHKNHYITFGFANEILFFKKLGYLGLKDTNEAMVYMDLMNQELSSKIKPQNEQAALNQIIKARIKLKNKPITLDQTIEIWTKYYYGFRRLKKQCLDFDTKNLDKLREDPINKGVSSDKIIKLEDNDDLKHQTKYSYQSLPYEQSIKEKEAAKNLKKIIKSWPETQQKIIKMIIKIPGSKKLSQELIAKKLILKQPTVSYHLKKIVLKLKESGYNIDLMLKISKTSK
ncbi:MAG: hypothetical protein Q8O93_05275 [bacterium]|nr:hypothetical protein [bacterium]